MEIMRASELNNRALQHERQGQYPEAEKLHLQAIELKLSSPLCPPSTIGVSYNGLGELYLSMGRLDDAEKMLFKAEDARRSYNDFDAACTRDNLGRLFEMKCDFARAREWREKGAPGKVICSYFNCGKSSMNRFSSRSELKACAKCNCAFYCGKACQTKDWKRHKVFCKKWTPQVGTSSMQTEEAAAANNPENDANGGKHSEVVAGEGMVFHTAH